MHCSTRYFVPFHDPFLFIKLTLNLIPDPPSCPNLILELEANNSMISLNKRQKPSTPSQPMPLVRSKNLSNCFCGS